MKKTNYYNKDLDSAVRELDGRVLNVLPKIQNDSVKELRTLDSLARLFKGTNNCTALFSKDNTVNVFHNPAPLKSVDNEFASQFFYNLSTIRTNGEKSLLELQILNIKSLIHDLSKNIVQIQTNVNPLNKAIIKLFDAVNGSLKGYVEELSSKVAEEYYKGKDNTAIWNKYISCLFSENIGPLLNLYQECYTLALQDESTSAKKIIRNFKDFNKVVKYYEKSALKNIEFPIVVDENGDDNLLLHAELQALEVLSSKAIKEALIGISKLCCYHCDYTFKIFNDVNKTLLMVRGTHGKIYLGWIFPENIQNGKKIKELFLENCNKILTNFKSYILDKSILDDPNNSLSDIEAYHPT